MPLPAAVEHPFMARPGRLYRARFAFDIQPEALARTESLLRESGLIDRVTLLLAGHEQMAAFVSVPVAAVILISVTCPVETRIVTRPGSTGALQQALALLRPGGWLLVAYPGTRRSDRMQSTLRLLPQLDAGRYSVSHLKLLNQDGNPPGCFRSIDSDPFSDRNGKIIII